ncbi:hypothetical protein C1646_757237 [Rhizophagus diaphanus]|nr:hypothetical protein C1646_757237 [Rhizophagus diaphanus] [Rhizophagus sp. MUCL 43196]
MATRKQIPVDEDADITLVNELGSLGGEVDQEENASKTTDQASTEFLNENSSATEALTLQDIPMDDVVNENTPQIQRPISWIDDLEFPLTQASSTAQKKRTSDLSASTEKSSGKDNSPVLKRLIQELTTDTSEDESTLQSGSAF